MKKFKLTISRDNSKFSVRGEGYSSLRLTSEEALAVVAHAIYDQGDHLHPFMKPLPEFLKKSPEEQQASAWMGVVKALDKASPGWNNPSDSAAESAVKAIENLARKAVRIDPTIVKPPVRECPPVDTLVEVKWPDSNNNWCSRYSAGKFKADGSLICFDDGKKSGKTKFTMGWKEWRLPEDNDGWIEWKGGPCPVYNFSKVKVRFRNGRETAKNFVRADNHNWNHVGTGGIVSHVRDCDIVAYKIVKD